MKKQFLFFTITILFCVENLISQTPADSNAYLGQTPPGDTPEIFAKGILSLSGRDERVLTFTPDGKEIYFSAENKILCFKEVDGEWSEAETASFITDYMDGANCYEPFISPDGTKLLFTSNKGSNGNNHNLWMTERTGDTWGETYKLSSAINTSSSGSWGEWHPCIVSNNNIYFARDGNIYFSEYLDNDYITAVRLNTICSSSQDWDPYVDPDEEFIIFKSNRPGGYGKMDNYISYKDTTSGTWSEPVNLGNTINSDWVDDAGDLSPDGKYFFYSRENDEGEMDVYWVKSGFINELNPFVSSIRKWNIKSEHLAVYPSPANEIVNIDLKKTNEKPAYYGLYDMVGRMVLNGMISSSAQIDISTLNTGLYLIQLKIEDYILGKKIVIE